MRGVFPIRLKAYFLFGEGGREGGWQRLQGRPSSPLLSHIPLLMSVLFDKNQFSIRSQRDSDPWAPLEITKVGLALEV